MTSPQDRYEAEYNKLVRQVLRLLAAMALFPGPVGMLSTVAAIYDSIEGGTYVRTHRQQAQLTIIRLAVEHLRDDAYDHIEAVPRAIAFELVWAGPGGIRDHAAHLADIGIQVPPRDTMDESGDELDDLRDLIRWLLELAWVSAEQFQNPSAFIGKLEAYYQ